MKEYAEVENEVEKFKVSDMEDLFLILKLLRLIGTSKNMLLILNGRIRAR